MLFWGAWRPLLSFCGGVRWSGLGWDGLHSYFHVQPNFSKMENCSGLMVGLPARIFMYCLLVLSKIGLCSGMMVALPALIFDSFMNCPLCLVKSDFEVAWWLHWLQGYLTPSCTTLWCLARSDFEVGWYGLRPQAYLTLSCTVLWCSTRIDFLVDW